MKKITVIGILACSILATAVNADPFKGASDETTVRVLRQNSERELQLQHNTCMSRVYNQTPGYTVEGCQKLYNESYDGIEKYIKELLAAREVERKKALAPKSTDETIAEYSRKLDQSISRYVVYNPDARGKSCKVNVKTDKGTVISTSGSGDDSVCVPAIRAIKAASPLPYPTKDAKAGEAFDDFNMNFAPSF